MSPLFAVTKSLDEIAAHFEVDTCPDVQVPTETVEGTPGLIVHEKDGLKHLKLIPWGFPRQTGSMRHSGEPPGRIGLVADLTSPLWERTVVDPSYRCLIPVTHFADPDGVKGEKTRTWFLMTRQPLMAWAGFCRNTTEYGPIFAGMTMAANVRVRPLNDRMRGVGEAVLLRFRSPSDTKPREHPEPSMLMDPEDPGSPLRRERPPFLQKKSSKTREQSISTYTNGTRRRI